MDTWMGRNGDPVTLHKYLYGNVDPVNMVDPTGNFAGNLGGLSAASGIANTLALTAIYAPGFIDSFRVSLFATGLDASPQLQTLLEKSPAAQKALELRREKLELRVKRSNRSKRKLVYHYTSRFAARSIMAMQCGVASRAYKHPDGEWRPSGFYATRLAPWTPTTQENLRAILYAKPTNQDVSHFVAIDDEGFTHKGAESYKRGPRGQCLGVTAIVTGVNLMSPR